MVHQTSIEASTIYFKLPYTHSSNFSKRKITSLVKQYCSDLNIKLIFTSLNIGRLFMVKDHDPKSLKQRACNLQIYLYWM